MKSFIPTSKIFFKKMSKRTIQSLIVIILIPTLLTATIQQRSALVHTNRRAGSSAKSQTPQKKTAAKPKTAAKGPKLDSLPKLHGASVASFGGEDVIDTTGAPTGVAVADFNGDGKPDVAVTGEVDSLVEIFLNTTPPGAPTSSFGTPVDFPVGDIPIGVYSADFNGDGKADLVVANADDDSISVLLNTTPPGDTTPSFSPEEVFSVGQGPATVVVGDFNGDGRADIAVCNQGSNNVSVRLNTTPTGSTSPAFGPRVNLNVGSLPTGLAIGDLNGDGRLDLVTSNLADDTISILLNTTAPGAALSTFAAAVNISTGASTGPDGVAIVDLNGDGVPDLAASNEIDDTVIVFINGTPPEAATPTFGVSSKFDVGAAPNSLTVGDFNGDGKPDLVSMDTFDDQVSVLLNVTNPGAPRGAFAPAQILTTGFSPVFAATADFNLDGKCDLVISNFDDDDLSVYLNSTVQGVALGAQTATNFVTGGSTPTAVTVADFNLDGKKDIAVTNFGSDNIQIRFNTTTPGSTTPSTAMGGTFATGTAPIALAAADFNGDGKPDLSYVNNGDGSVSVRINSTTPGSSSATFGASADFTVGTTPIAVAAGDLNGDGKPDLVVVNNGDGNITVLLNTTAPGATTATFGAPANFNVGTAPVAIALADFNGDGRADIVVGNGVSNDVSVLINLTTPGSATPSFGTADTFAAGTAPTSVTTGDMNGDGLADLIVGSSSNPVIVLINLTAAGATSSSFTPTAFSAGAASAVVAGDFNQDGVPDVASAISGGGSVAVFRNTTPTGDATPTLAGAVSFGVGTSPNSLAIADFNGDGKRDIVSANSGSDNISILLNSAAGPATNLVIKSVNSGIPPAKDVPFAVEVESQDNLGNPFDVVADTDVTLSLTSGIGILGGTLTGTITAGTHSLTFPAVTYDTVDFDVIITATATSGDTLNPGDSAPFNVLAVPLVAEAFTDPAGVCGGNTPCFTHIQEGVEAVLPNGTVQVGPGQYLNGSGPGFEDVFIDQPVNVNINGDITVEVLFMEDDNAVLNGLSATISISDEWEQDAGTFNAGTGTVSFVATAPGPPQVICGTVETVFNNLTIDNGTINAVLDSNKFVTGVLSLNGGSSLFTDSFTLTMTNTATSTGTGDVIGALKRTGIDTAPLGTSFSFGNPFNTISIDSGAPPTDITVIFTDTTPDDVATGETNSGFPNAVARTYVITPNGGSGFSATLQLHYQTDDLNLNDENALSLWRFNNLGGDWENKGADSRDLTNHSVTRSGIMQFSPWTLNSTVPTAVRMENFQAVQNNGGALLQWQTGFEANNLGFNVYRQQGGERVKINPSLIAGSALMSSATRLEAGQSYSWQDNVADSTASYWLEDVDLNGKTQWHGPVGIDSSLSSSGPISNSALLTDLNNSAARQASGELVREYVAGFDSVPAGTATKGSAPSASQAITAGRTTTKSASSVSSSMQKQWQIAAQPAVKIAINKTGWYHVSMNDILAAGLSANPNNLQMFVGGVEVPIKVNAGSIEFYGSALNTATTDTQVYWLTAGMGSGKRIAIQASPGATSNNGPTSFQYTVERKDRTVYFSSLRNGDAENWFGSVISSQPVNNSISIHKLDTNDVGSAQLEVALQGVSAKDHQVTVSVNGQAVQAVSFSGMDHKVSKFSLPIGSLIEGDNQITFSAGASGDVSIVDYIRVTYAHTYTADNNTLSTTAVPMQPIKVTGFTSDQILAFDVANPAQPIELNGTIDGQAGNYGISVDGGKRRNLLVFTSDKMLQPLSITGNQPSNLTVNAGADFVVITNKDFAQSIQPLVNLRQSQGYQVAVVDVEDIYDQFSYGVHSPQAVKEFLNWTYLHWPKQPQYVMLAGSATLDPRNYSGLGYLDFVPTKLVDITTMETASDDWFVDFNDDGKPQMAIGRLPIRTASDAQIVVSKIIAYEQSGASQGVVLVSDLNDGINFKANNDQIKSMLPTQLKTTTIVRGQTGTDARTQLLDQLTQGGRIINYAGHGSVNLWRGGLLSAADAQTLANHPASPLVVTMTCLNGYFQDPHLASLGESLLRVNKGGAVSVWASSGMSRDGDQTTMNREFFKQLFGGGPITIGDAIKQAKSAVKNDDVRKTWILFGDPTMKIK